MDGAAPLRTLVVDDERLALQRHVQLCAGVDGVEVVGALGASRDVPDAVAALRPDLVLLDVSMPGVDGMTLGRSLALLPDGPALVFATAHAHFAVDAFEVAAVDYLLKPVAPERLHQAIARVRAIVGARPSAPAYLDAIWVPQGARLVRLGVADIELIEAERDYVRVHALGRAFLRRGTIQQLQRQLDPARFVRVHRSAVVPIGRIHALTSKVGRCTVETASGHKVRVGRSFRGELARAMERLAGAGAPHGSAPRGAGA